MTEKRKEEAEPKKYLKTVLASPRVDMFSQSRPSKKGKLSEQLKNRQIAMLNEKGLPVSKEVVPSGAT